MCESAILSALPAKALGQHRATLGHRHFAPYQNATPCSLNDGLPTLFKMLDERRSVTARTALNDNKAIDQHGHLNLLNLRVKRMGVNFVA